MTTMIWISGEMYVTALDIVNCAILQLERQLSYMSGFGKTTEQAPVNKIVSGQTHVCMDTIHSLLVKQCSVIAHEN